MQYVGVACSVGMAVQLPLILRSLADSLAFVPASDLPIKIDKDFLSWMGSIPYAHIPEHAMNWWASKAARKLPGALFARVDFGTVFGDISENTRGRPFTDHPDSAAPTVACGPLCDVPRVAGLVHPGHGKPDWVAEHLRRKP